MTTADDLLRTILAEPADDAPRLVYADWLEDRGGPGDAERSEFIRVQVELARLEGAYVVPLVRSATDLAAILDATLEYKREDLHRRERELLEAHGQRGWPGCDWCPEIWADGFTPEAVEFRRGFPAQVCCALQDWLRHGPAIVRSSPLEVVEVSDRHGHEHGNAIWYFTDAPPPPGPHGRHWLPRFLLPLMPEPRSRLDGDHCAYDTPEAARLALSMACLAWSWQPSCRECGGGGWRRGNTPRTRDAVVPGSPCHLCHGLGRDLNAPSERPQRR